MSGRIDLETSRLEIGPKPPRTGIGAVWRLAGICTDEASARQPLSCLSRCRCWTVRTCCPEQTIVFDVGTNATQGHHYGTLW